MAIITKAELARLDDAEGEDNDLFSAYQFAPAFALSTWNAEGAPAVFLIHFCVNSEGDNDIDEEHFKMLLREALALLP